MLVDTFSALIILATFLGPITAVVITRWTDIRRERRNQRMYVFRTLMRTRKMPVTLDHVMALNLVEVEFYKCSGVISIFRELIAHYTNSYGDDKTVEELKAANERAERIKTRMLSAMAAVLNYKYGEIDLFEGGYVPRAWAEELAQQELIKRGLIQVLSGLAPLQVAPFEPRPIAGQAALPNVFPPKPT